MSLASLQSPQQITLKHDINALLTTFNQLDELGTGFINKAELLQFLTLIKIYPIYSESTDEITNPQNQLSSQIIFKNNEQFDFETVLSLLGAIEVPQQPSIYVISFVKVLSQYRNKCIERDQVQQNSLGETIDKGLLQAKEIDQKIKKIIKKELERQKERMIFQHQKIYEQMERTQNSQYKNFQQEWKKYLDEFREQTHEKLNKTRAKKMNELSYQSQKVAKSVRRHSMVTSPKLQQLLQKKKWLVKQGRYSDAIKINHQIDFEKRKIEQHNQTSLDYSMRKRIQSLKKKNQSAMSYIQSQMKNNMGRLLSKKKQGENLMRIRMRNLQQEAERKLNDHMRSELSRLRAIFGRAAR